MRFKRLILLFVGFWIVSDLSAASLQTQDEVVRKLFQDGNFKSAQLYLDTLLQLKTFSNPEERIRVTLLDSLAAGHAGNFERSYELLAEARNLLEWSGFRDRLTYNTKARERISQSIELLAHDLRALEAQ